MQSLCDVKSVSDQQYALDDMDTCVNSSIFIWEEIIAMGKQTGIDDIMQHIGTHKVYDDITLVVLKQQ